MRILVPAVALIISSCRRESPAPVEEASADTVATVGTARLLKSDLEYATGTAGSRPASSVLESIMDEEALAQLARSEGLDRDPSVRAAVRRMLASRLMEKHLPETAITSEELAAAATSAAPAPPGSPRQHLAFLRQKFEDAGGEDEAVKKLKKARGAWLELAPDSARKGFGPLAVEYSDDSDTRYQGGDAGWIKAGERHVLLPPEVTTAAAQHSGTGLVSEIIRAAGAAWLVIVTEVKTPEPAAVVNPEQLRATLTAAKEQAAREALKRRAREAAPAKILIPQTDSAIPPAAPAPPKLP